MSKLCAKCGTPLSDDDQFCGVCGARLEMPAMQQDQKRMGQPSEYTYQQPNQIYEQPPIKPTQAKKKKTGLLLGILGGVIAVAVIVTVLLVTDVISFEGGNKGIVDTWFSSRLTGQQYMVAFDADGLVYFTDNDTYEKSTYEFSDGSGVILAPGTRFEDAELLLVDGVLYIDGVAYYRDREEVPNY